MCGFVGFLTNKGVSAGDLDSAAERMALAIAHRGPDGAGTWSDGGTGIALGHRRLAIVDLSPAGHQPMASEDGRYVLVFNGEIYNHMELRRELERSGAAPAWRGHSDTETLLAGFATWGTNDTVGRCVGMFAFALWDKSTRTLTLGRDRLGEKPLYYGWQKEGGKAAFLFGSELKALRAHSAFENRIDRGALALQLRHNHIPAPYSIYEGIAKLPQASLLTVSLAEPEPKISCYWSAAEKAEAGVRAPFEGTVEQAVDELEALLKNAIGQQMMADVPLGAFLSGGVDSSTVVALMQAQSERPVKTFSIGFHEAGFNEAEHAKSVAAHLGTDHTELYVTAEQAMAVIPRLPQIYDEPFADSSQIPTFLVSQLARDKVTVSLSGDAGDELFCGYNRYTVVDRLWNKLAAVPVPVRKLAARSFVSLSPTSWNKLAGGVRALAGGPQRYVNFGDKVHKGAAVLASNSLDALYLNLVSHWRDPADVVVGVKVPTTQLDGKAPPLDGLCGVQRMMALDTLTYLPDDILCKVDRAAMGISLETRVPFLDHRVVEFAWRLPQSLKLREGQSKWVLRQVLYRHVPKALIERPKMGFGVPIGEWLRGPLRAWAEALLDETRLQEEGFFHPAPIRRKWAEHLSGQRNWESQLWNVLMFQAWYEQNR